jgi:fructose-1,6-bisphosphatase/sedoheptulose 1,7-bisphosphatase-like protein
VVGRILDELVAPLVATRASPVPAVEADLLLARVGVGDTPVEVLGAAGVRIVGHRMNHKRKRPKHQRAGCLMCKPHKDERLAKRPKPSVRRKMQDDE